MWCVQCFRYRLEVIPSVPGEKVFYEDKNKPESIIRLEQMHKFDPFFDVGHFTCQINPN